MKTFLEWLTEDTAGEIKNAFDSFGGAFKQGMDEKNTEYANRILAGERPEVVLQGMRPNGAMWNAVMQKVQELQQTNQPQTQFSISGLENKLGLRNGSLAVDKSRDGRFVFVRNRLNGKSISTQPTPQSIEQAARKLFSLV